ncbi:MAG TPA: uroporphyrinogen decarboxylase family protein [Candidatus Brocadiia bacterium]|nr:uroporphyrinogen decarboxylase family protein [Candidatus Brocadiia bacterium]
MAEAFGPSGIGHIINCLSDADILTGVYGGCFVPGLFGVPIRYAKDGWPACEHRYLSDDEAARLKVPDLDNNPLFCDLMRQVDWINSELGKVAGYINWQGVLNTAYRLRGESIFTDMSLEPGRADHVFSCVAETMMSGARRLYAAQAASGFDVRHFTVSNCMVNMISPEKYAELLLPYDVRLAEEFGLLGVHNCAWNANPYLEPYSRIPNVGYIDMGGDSDLRRAREIFPQARRAFMYTPMDAADKPLSEITRDLRRIALYYGPCDVVFADLEWNVDDEKVVGIINCCRELSKESAEESTMTEETC